MADYDAACCRYLTAVLDTYRDAPFTPHRTTPADVAVAERWYDADVPLATVRLAVTLVAVRIILGSTTARVRSIAYYRPLVSDLLAARPVDQPLRGAQH